MSGEDIITKGYKNVTQEWLEQKGNLQVRRADRKFRLNGKEVLLYSLREAAHLCRQNRERFLKDFHRVGCEAFRIGKRTFISLDSIREYQDHFIVKG